MAFSLRLLSLCLGICSPLLITQKELYAQQISPSSLITSALQNSSLGMSSQTFHAVLNIGQTGEFSGKVEIWWRANDQYRLQITSPSFSQTKIVSGTTVEESDTGDYYPRWLENFVLALLNPVPEPGKFTSGSLSAQRSQDGICLQRNDRPGGITDELTWGHLCFTGSSPVVSSILTFNQTITFSDWQKFGTQRIARQYETSVRDYQPVSARLSKLEKWTPEDSLLRAEHAASADQRIDTRFVSTLTEEAMVEHAPQIVWPPVREGKTEGYMIVYARTDRTGQVRETAKHNSDQPGLEEFGMQQALRYKFKPLVVNGVAKQMEMPLVLHFTSTLTDPIPILSAQEMKKQMGSCSVPKLSSEVPQGASIQVQVSIDETGKLTGSKPIGNVSGTGWVQVVGTLRDCRFAPLVRDGKPTYYKGILEMKP